MFFHLLIFALLKSYTMKKFLLFLPLLFLLSLQSQGQTIKDIDGNVYNTVTIGNQVWMKENLRTTRLNDGTPIKVITDNLDWDTQTSPARCWYKNDSAAYHNVYGIIYNDLVLHTNKVCPQNWHVPSKDEWTTLFSFLGGKEIAGNKMKDTSSLWLSPNKADNLTGFSALPGGYRPGKNGFQGLNVAAYFFEYSTTNLSKIYQLHYSEISVGSFQFDGTNYGATIRCISDFPASQSENLNPPSSFHLYPNPATDQLFISSDLHLNAEVMIFSPLGECMLRQSISANAATIDISALKAGVYFVRLTNESGRVQQKFLKQ